MSSWNNYNNSNYSRYGMMKSLINRIPNGSSGNSYIHPHRPDYPTAEWPIPGKRYAIEVSPDGYLSNEGMAELAKDRREYAEKERAKFKMEKDPLYNEQFNWTKPKTWMGGKRRTRKARKSRKSRKSRRTRIR